MIETSKIIQALCYLLSKVKKADKLKLVKLLYLADKYHIIRYARTVSNDEYWAMDYGPVGSTAKDILGFDREFLSKEFEYAEKMLTKVSQNFFVQGTDCAIEELNKLSETDIEALDFVAEKFGSLSTHQLIKLTHRYPEWAQYKELFKNQMTRRERIEDRELLSVLDDDVLAVSRGHLEESANILSGLSN
ncbi:MAG: hypothetical protein A2Y65_02700 [Deltaproteobacteria bacterium RBG_13_52_11]|nr:MAG: hypothetical protein A2Y65_02700 [Deltaproteobacteria bacterium RBG_13_52_11]